MCGRELRWAPELQAAALGLDDRDKHHVQNFIVGCASAFLFILCARLV